MLASTAGPPRKPVLAATNSSPPSSAKITQSVGFSRAGLWMASAMMARNVTALSVSPSAGRTSHRR